MNVTSDFVQKANIPGEYRDSRLLGFLVKVSTKGVKSYQVQGRIKGRETIRCTIGKHGAPWTATSAREEADRLLHLMKRGIDPRVEERERMAQHAAILEQEKLHRLRRELTLKTVFESWSGTEQVIRDSTKELYQQVMWKHLSDWVNMPLYEITPEMVVKRYDKVCEKTIGSANNCFRALRRLYNWALLEYENSSGESPISNNPVSVLSKRKKWRKLKSRTEVVADSDLKPFFCALEKIGSACYRDYFTLLLVTGLRKSEARKLRWRDVNFKMRSFTVFDTKNGRDHTLPMTDFTEELLKRRREIVKNTMANSEYVFPSSKRTTHIKDVSHYQEKILEISGIRFTPHWLRRTFSYAAAKVRLGDSERKALLNHMGAA